MRTTLEVKAALARPEALTPGQWARVADGLEVAAELVELAQPWCAGLPVWARWVVRLAPGYLRLAAKGARGKAESGQLPAPTPGTGTSA